jgi:hypothetical protein
VVKVGAALPDITTVDAFKRALIAATSVAYIDPKAGDSSGIYFDKLIQRLGIAIDVRAKAKSQISEIVSVKGAALAGPLPADMQNFSTYSAGLGAAARETAAARALIQFLSGPALGPTLKAKRIEKPGARLMRSWVRQGSQSQVRPAQLHGRGPPRRERTSANLSITSTTTRKFRCLSSNLSRIRCGVSAMTGKKPI